MPPQLLKATQPVDILPTIPFGWAGSGLEVREHAFTALVRNQVGKLLEDGFTLAKAEDADALKEVLPKALAFVHEVTEALRIGRVPLEKLLVSQKLSRELGEYSSPSPAARAVRQLEATGKEVRPGQRVRFLFTLGKPGVRACGMFRINPIRAAWM